MARPRRINPRIAAQSLPRAQRGGVRLPGAGQVVMPQKRALTASQGDFMAGTESELEMILLNRLERAGLPPPVRQFRFDPSRRWRADFAYPAARLLIEVDGGTWSGGRHVRGKGFEADCEKQSTAAALGFRVIRVTRALIEDGTAVALIRRAFKGALSESEEV